MPVEPIHLYARYKTILLEAFSTTGLRPNFNPHAMKCIRWSDLFLQWFRVPCRKINFVGLSNNMPFVHFISYLFVLGSDLFPTQNSKCSNLSDCQYAEFICGSQLGSFMFGFYGHYPRISWKSRDVNNIRYRNCLKIAQTSLNVKYFESIWEQYSRNIPSISWVYGDPTMSHREYHTHPRHFKIATKDLWCRDYLVLSQVSDYISYFETLWLILWRHFWVNPSIP